MLPFRLIQPLTRNFASAALGYSIARLGDYNNDGVDDFAVAAPFYNSNAGLVAIVSGIAAGLPASITLPSAFGAGSIRVDGEAGSTDFGVRVLGLGSFYGTTTTPALAVAAPFASTNAGKLYAFMGASGGSISASAAINTVTGAAGEYIGYHGLNALGNVGPGGQTATGVAVIDVSPSRVDGWSGAAASGPFNIRASYTSSESTTSTFGRMIVGGGASGRAATFSFIGSSRSDVAITTRANATPRLYIIDGDKVTMPSSSTVESIADVTVSLIGTFNDFSQQVTAIPDLDGDGYGDLVVAETDYSGVFVSGHVVVLR